MSMLDQNPYISYTANGATSTFAYPFRIFKDTDLVVKVAGVAKLLTTDYTVTGVDAQGGGNVVFNVNPANGALVEISRSVPFVRDTDYVSTGDFRGDTVDKDVDRLVALLQQIRDPLTRALKLPAGVTVDQILTGSAADRANKVVGFDGAGNLLLAALSAGFASSLAAAPNTVPLRGADGRTVLTDYVADTGAANAYVLTLNPALTAHEVGRPIRFKAATANTGASTVAINALVAIAIKRADGSALQANDIKAGQMVSVAYDGAYYQLQVEITKSQADSLYAAVGHTHALSPVRQTVLAGPVDASGYPSFLPATSVNLSLSTQNITAQTPLIVSAANGFALGGEVNRVGMASATFTWVGLTASTTNYLYVDIAADGTLTQGFTTLAPDYQWGGARSTANGQATFNIQEMSMTVGDGIVAAQAYRMFVGEAVTNGATVTSTVAYAYQGRYNSGWVTPLPATSSVISKNHNIGTAQIKASLVLKNLTAELGYSVGQIAYDPFTNSGGNVVPINKVSDKNTAGFSTGNTTAWALYNRTTPVGGVSLTSANWAYAIQAERGW